jgi:uncharacterized SAM-binding protein YcdF (DUF218 family)
VNPHLPHQPKRIALVSLLVALTLACWFIGLSLFIRSASGIPMGPLKKLDAIVVLTGGSNRVDTGFDLLEQGFGKKLFISGVYRGTDVKLLLNRWKAEPQNNLDCCVVLGFDADNTAGNAVETVNWLRKEGFHSLYLVTANYHLRRALLEFHDLAPDLDIVPFAVVPDKVNVKGWWRDSVTRNIILREYIKYLLAYTWHVIGKLV